MKNTKLTTLICGLIAMAATVIFCLLAFDNIFAVPMYWVSLTFLLVSEVIGTLKAIFANKNVITRASIFTSVAHFAAVSVISIVFVNFFPLSLKTYILLNILLLCAIAEADLLVLYFGNNVSESNKTSANRRATMDACYAKARGLAVLYGQSEWKKDLIEIADLIRFSDNSELTDDECAVMKKLGELETQLRGNGENVSALISEIKNTIDLRTVKTENIKRGGC